MRAGGFLFCVWRLKGFTLRYPIIVMIYRSNPLVECMPLYGLRNAKSYTCNPPQFDLKKLFQKILKKGLTKRGFCYILNKSSAMSHQKRQQLNKMESWLSGRRRTIGNRVGVMSVSRVQIPNSPPEVSCNRKIAALFASGDKNRTTARRGGKLTGKVAA